MFSPFNVMYLHQSTPSHFTKFTIENEKIRKANKKLRPSTPITTQYLHFENLETQLFILQRNLSFIADQAVQLLDFTYQLQNSIQTILENSNYTEKLFEEGMRQFDRMQDEQSSVSTHSSTTTD